MNDYGFLIWAVVVGAILFLPVIKKILPWVLMILLLAICFAACSLALYPFGLL